ncbi:hypothetical protein BC936DRAFT_146386 [Jimgerdemannia flammicorona]|uniref:Transcription factor CBF/NF-Y/archaeal histone domain-containing protein n=1 Tax=Jimgerdemannia flammicorona TaxID=994334 RepID=A0A433D7V0_9FUNG|nr:hypothetical protein BC936DRAFT_146386 [Jimgerdemannia flammicorona]
MVSQNHQQQMAALLQQQQQLAAVAAAQQVQAQATAVAGSPGPQQQQQQVAAGAAGAVVAEPNAAGAVAGSQPVFDNLKFWQEQNTLAESFDSDFKNHPLPLARIKKVMKSDQDVKAPILFAKGCEIFISELTQRAWIHAEENKRRTLQRSDIANAISKTDMCDFLIDIVPREEVPKLPMRRAKDEVRPRGRGEREG